MAQYFRAKKKTHFFSLRPLYGPEHMARNAMTISGKVQRRLDLITDRFAIGATGMKRTTRGWMDGTGDIALQNGSLFFPAGVGHGHSGEQRPGIGMLGVLIDGFTLGDLDDLAEVHDRHSMADVLDDSQIMGDEKVRQMHFLL